MNPKNLVESQHSYWLDQLIRRSVDTYLDAPNNQRDVIKSTGPSFDPFGPIEKPILQSEGMTNDKLCLWLDELYEKYGNTQTPHDSSLIAVSKFLLNGIPFLHDLAKLGKKDGHDAVKTLEWIVVRHQRRIITELTSLVLAFSNNGKIRSLERQQRCLLFQKYHDSIKKAYDLALKHATCFVVRTYSINPILTTPSIRGFLETHGERPFLYENAVLESEKSSLLTAEVYYQCALSLQRSIHLSTEELKSFTKLATAHESCMNMLRTTRYRLDMKDEKVQDIKDGVEMFLKLIKGKLHARLYTQLRDTDENDLGNCCKERFKFQILDFEYSEPRNLHSNRHDKFFVMISDEEENQLLKTSVHRLLTLNVDKTDTFNECEKTCKNGMFSGNKFQPIGSIEKSNDSAADETVDEVTLLKIDAFFQLDKAICEILSYWQAGNEFNSAVVATTTVEKRVKERESNAQNLINVRDLHALNCENPRHANGNMTKLLKQHFAIFEAVQALERYTVVELLDEKLQEVKKKLECEWHGSGINHHIVQIDEILQWNSNNRTQLKDPSLRAGCKFVLNDPQHENEIKSMLIKMSGGRLLTSLLCLDHIPKTVAVTLTEALSSMLAGTCRWINHTKKTDQKIKSENAPQGFDYNVSDYTKEWLPSVLTIAWNAPHSASREETCLQKVLISNTEAGIRGHDVESLINTKALRWGLANTFIRGADEHRCKSRNG